MKRTVLWVLAFLITTSAAIYQRKTGPTNPVMADIRLNDSLYTIKLVRSIGLDERSEIKLNITDTCLKATLYYKRYKSQDEYRVTPFIYKEYPVDSYVMNRIFGITTDKGFFSEVPPQPPAGKIEYFIEFTDRNGVHTLMEETPVIIRFKGGVPPVFLVPHIILMFLAMFYSTTAGLFALNKVPSYKKYGRWTLTLLVVGGLILGPIVQKYAFGQYWTGIPVGWDLTDNKLLIALIFWITAVVMNWKSNKPFVTFLAAVVLLVIYSIPHSLFGSVLDYESGQVIQGLFPLLFILRLRKKS